MTQDSLTDIQDKFNSILEYTQGYSITSDKLFEDWWVHKARLRKTYFQGELIRNLGKVEFHLTPEEKKHFINQFLDMSATYMPYDTYKKFEDFIWENRDSFFDNTVTKVTLPDQRDFKVGMKLVKAFKFFINNHGALTRVQEIASSYIQKEKMTGEFCISIHPLDFLTSSVNTYNWRSCHALDGEYRAGNLSYMSDNVTFMCYIKGEDVLRAPHLPNGVTWNSKKWRMFMYIDPTDQLCFLGRQYPYALCGIEKFISSKILPRPGSWNPFTDTYIDKFDGQEENLPLNDKYYAISTREGNQLVKLHDLVKDSNEQDPLHYNDLLFSHCYHPKYTSRWLFMDNPTIPKLVVGSDVKCMCCEQENIYAESDSMLCKSCAIDLGVIDPLEYEDDVYEYEEDEE